MFAYRMHIELLLVDAAARNERRDDQLLAYAQATVTA